MKHRGVNKLYKTPPSALSRRRLLFGFVTAGAGAAVSLQARADSDRGKILQRELDDRNKYFLYVPRDLRPDSPLLVSIHGISRNARQHVEAFARMAERRGVVVLAPVFSDYRYGDYQRLGRRGRGGRADLALQRLTSHVIFESGLVSSKFYLYGHSGGAQFAHRYAMAYPHDVAALGLSAAGWYTLPNDDQSYPYGIRPTSDSYGLTLDPREFLRVPACVFVGEDDISRDGAFNRSDKLDSMQGRNRIERAAYWVESMNRAARALGYDTPYSLHVLRDADHDFDELVAAGLAQELFDCLFAGSPEPSAVQL
jgi:pimeloyl-ACP methyl ester carboxylesterase